MKQKRKNTIAQKAAKDFILSLYFNSYHRKCELPSPRATLCPYAFCSLPRLRFLEGCQVLSPELTELTWQKTWKHRAFLPKGRWALSGPEPMLPFSVSQGPGTMESLRVSFHLIVDRLDWACRLDSS